MDKSQIIDLLKSKLYSEFKKDFDKTKGNTLHSKISADDLFNRYIKTTESINKHNKIATFCLRLSQFGIVCYPSSNKAEYTGVKSTLLDDEIKHIIFADKFEENIESTLIKLCEAN